MPGTLSIHGRSSRAVVHLMRPVNLVLFAAGVALGGLLTAGLSAFEGERGARLLIAAISAALLGGGANSINDVFDLEIDRINRPDRPLPSGRVSPRAARWVWGIASALGVALSFLLSGAHVGIALVAVGSCYAYSAHFKRTPLAGNVLVAFVTPLALIVYGGWAVGPPGPALVAAAFAFLTTLAREVVKDLQDVVGDEAAGARTLPLVYGPHVAAQVTAGVLLLTILLTPLPFLLLGYSGLFLLLVLLADALLLRVVWLVLDPTPQARAARASRLLKGAMVCGIAALACAHVA